MPPISEILKQNTESPKRPEPVAAAPEKPKTVEIKSATDLADALAAAREMIMYTYFTKNIEVTGIAEHKISYFDRGNDAEFQKKLVIWLNTKTGTNWELEKMEESHQNKTVREQIKNDAESDPMVADAMSLFEGAEIVGISKQ